MVDMMRLSAEDVLKRHDKALTRKENFRNLYEEAYEFALPQRNLYDGHYDGKVGGNKKMNRVFDSTAINSTQRFANRMQSGIFPPQRKWCRLEPGSDIPQDRQAEAQAALDMYNDKLFDTLKQSNFDVAIGEFLLDLSVGTAVMMVQPGDDINPINFIPVPQYLVSIEEGANGTVDNVYRQLKIKAEAVIREFPDAKMTVELTEAIERRPDQEIDLRDAVIFDQDTGRYHYHVFWPAKKQELLYKEMKSSPFVVSRYMKVAGEGYGRGPLVTAIADIKTLNKTLELVLKNASLSIAGVYTAADDGVLNPQNIKIQPGAVVAVARNGGPNGASLAPLPRAGDFNTSQIVINDLRMNIKKIMMDDTLPPDNMSARSATEISERTRELATNLGSAFGRLITETMLPIIARTLYVMDQQGLIDMPLKVNGAEVKVTPVSPLAQAQKLQEVNDVMQYMQIANSMGPQGQVSVSVPKVLAFIAQRLGIDQNILNSPEEQEQMMMQMQQAMRAQQAGAEAPPVDDGGAMEGAMI